MNIDSSAATKKTRSKVIGLSQSNVQTFDVHATVDSLTSRDIKFKQLKYIKYKEKEK